MNVSIVICKATLYDPTEREYTASTYRELLSEMQATNSCTTFEEGAESHELQDGGDIGLMIGDMTNLGVIEDEHQDQHAQRPGQRQEESTKAHGQPVLAARKIKTGDGQCQVK